jgi:DNA-binding XRE family transcriptional regulator
LNIKKYIHKKQIKIADGITRNKWTWQTLADTLGVSRQTLYNWDGGESYPTTPQAIDLAKLLGVTFGQLIKEEK